MVIHCIIIQHKSLFIFVVVCVFDRNADLKTIYFCFTVNRRSLDMMRVRATDPRPCPKCGKIYRSAHTLRTHLEDKHTVCPGYRCVLCGTVAKSRNSLHSHMSRQHRGISTKDLPVLPMPSPFDPDLASRLLAKAGVKVSAAELRARSSPTGPPRRYDDNFHLEILYIFLLQSLEIEPENLAWFWMIDFLFLRCSLYITFWGFWGFCYCVLVSVSFHV